ncbi:hypothetical protein NDU88_001258 [Pleurodeles waltl]|uniref:Uncharacterized protein n=1 Tax=Pleurodeles waltl TaxID=8319 RepID=A0AAV7SAG3_PLEWA|nr:hypothetical protein NDU88_001258 [Pleurodeles waltl]
MSACWAQHGAEGGAIEEQSTAREDKTNGGSPVPGEKDSPAEEQVSPDQRRWEQWGDDGQLDRGTQKRTQVALQRSRGPWEGTLDNGGNTEPQEADHRSPAAHQSLHQLG